MREVVEVVAVDIRKDRVNAKAPNIMVDLEGVVNRNKRISGTWVRLTLTALLPVSLFQRAQ